MLYADLTLFLIGCLYTMLRAFVDDSGSGGDSKWFVLAGYVGTVQQWELFDAPWIAALHAFPPIEYFKASEAAVHNRGAWKQIEPKDIKGGWLPLVWQWDSPLFHV